MIDKTVIKLLFKIAPTTAFTVEQCFYLFFSKLLCGLNEYTEGSSSGTAQWSSVCEICCEGIHMLSIQKVSL